MTNEGWHWSKALAWNEWQASRDIEFNIYALKGTKKLKDLICAQNWRPVEVGHNTSNNEKVIESQF